jgi:hypothetical protein
LPINLRPLKNKRAASVGCSRDRKSFGGGWTRRRRAPDLQKPLPVGCFWELVGVQFSHGELSRDHRRGCGCIRGPDVCRRPNWPRDQLRHNSRPKACPAIVCPRRIDFVVAVACSPAGRWLGVPKVAPFSSVQSLSRSHTKWWLRSCMPPKLPSPKVAGPATLPRLLEAGEKEFLPRDPLQYFRQSSLVQASILSKRQFGGVRSGPSNLILRAAICLAATF